MKNLSRGARRIESLESREMLASSADIIFILDESRSEVLLKSGETLPLSASGLPA